MSGIGWMGSCSAVAQGGWNSWGRRREGEGHPDMLPVIRLKERPVEQAIAELEAKEDRSQGAKTTQGPLFLPPGHALFAAAEDGGDPVFGRVDPADKGEDHGMGWRGGGRRGSLALAAGKEAHRVGINDCFVAQR